MKVNYEQIPRSGFGPFSSPVTASAVQKGLTIVEKCAKYQIVTFLSTFLMLAGYLRPVQDQVGPHIQVIVIR